MMSSRYIAQKISRYSRSASLTRYYIVPGALHKPKGIIVYSEYPKRQRKAVFYSSSFTIRTRLYAPRRSNLVKNFLPVVRSISSVISGRAWRFLIVITLRPR